MARDNAVLEQHENERGDGADDGGGPRVWVSDRRSYLKLAGSTVAMAGVTAGSAGATDRSVRESSNDRLPNEIRIAGLDEPSSFEITVDGELDMAVDNPVREAIVVSGSTAEGAVDADGGAVRFLFSGSVTELITRGGETSVSIAEETIDPTRTEG